MWHGAFTSLVPVPILGNGSILWHFKASDNDDFFAAEGHRGFERSIATLRPSDHELVSYQADPPSSRSKLTLKEHLG